MRMLLWLLGIVIQHTALVAVVVVISFECCIKYYHQCVHHPHFIPYVYVFVHYYYVCLDMLQYHLCVDLYLI